MSSRSHKTVGIKVFLTIFGWDPYLSLMDPDQGGPKTYESHGSGSATLSEAVFLCFAVALTQRVQIRRMLDIKKLTVSSWTFK
jgi:hypothetical protein